ncbi:YqgE/AlgH family protein [Komagataeibacter diospyri]|uniref:UPF0301 protein MSKU9_1549 n=1 Tax=Komagataeibacter diospyri TaxID=1932662 RepID=A0A4P5NP61_9PROT|nr:YqgE/AlgH family protein [Komagataeibacter diospyri]GCE83408.1 transcriptional regulator [Komagataeibacter diospyri]GCE90157.1 transcriptional regulator [Komagataeibacter diospyri]
MASFATTPGCSLTGHLLVATPALTDPAFARSVVYLCAHTPEDGAMGLVVNRRLSQPVLDDVLEQLGIAPVPPRRRINLCAGGPMDNGRGFVLHTSDWSGDGSLPVDRTTTLTASLDVLRDIADGNGPAHALLAMGHASWEAGQLEEEMLHHDAWIAAPATENIVFGADHNAKWRQALASVRIDPAWYSATPGHA